MRGTTWRRIGQFSSVGSIKLKKYGVIPRASLVLASCVPANSSGVSVGNNSCNCSRVLTRCLSCQRQSFQSASETSDQKPRPADLNSLRKANGTAAGSGLSSPSSELCLCIVRELLGRDLHVSSG